MSPYTLAAESLPTRAVQHASVLVGLYGADVEFVAAALDVNHNSFAKLPGLPPGRWCQLLSLSPSGRHLLYRAPHRQPFGDGFFVQHLATTKTRTFEGPAGTPAVRACMSPDERFIATLSHQSDPQRPNNPRASLVVLDVLDVSTGQYRRLWERKGNLSRESVLSWNPGGTRIAGTYAGSAAGVATIVAEVAADRPGNPIRKVQVLPSGNGSWLDDEHLLCIWNFGRVNQQLASLDVISGTHRVIAPCHLPPLGRLADRLLTINDVSQSAPTNDFGGAAISTADLSGDDQQPFLTIDAPQYMLSLFDTWMTPAEPALQP